MVKQQAFDIADKVEEQALKAGRTPEEAAASAEQLKEQDPDLLNLYHINVKRDVNPTQSALGSNIPLNNSITQRTQNVNIRFLLFAQGEQLGSPFRHFPDGKCFRAGARGFCLSVLRTSNKNIAPPFSSPTQAKQFACSCIKN